ncbi:metal-dependent hydrolase [Bacillus carboniphilus]|uniref:Metal-dependent hydrolase n=1 Tax=Bacillus carboniphilus TaxID=86663 RepID=A0ABY9JSW0_9BACI|nr:metal-dependent hydrolase [Bacillus carboniphilus]WLR42486.1 metal-dependent hydrolase [Bacillus carboniphilus]
MTGKTHMMAGVATCAVAFTITNDNPAILITSGMIGSLLPDICHSGSKIGRRFPFLSKIINSIFGHRTFTHSLLFLFIIASLLKTFIPFSAISTGVLLGMISHFVLDGMTKRGIMLFYPLKKSIRFPMTTKTGSLIEQVVFLGLAIVSIYYGKDIIQYYL